MTQSQRKKRKRDDLRIAAKVMPAENAKLLPMYAANLWVPHRYKIIYGGRGGARSWSVARALLLMAAQSKIRVLCTREMQSSIKDSVHQLLRDQIDLMGLEGYIVTDREIRHVNGSLFIFKGLRHNATSIKSLEAVDICWVEEAERITKESWSILIPTIRKKGSEIWVTFNPDQEHDATYTRFILNSPKDTWKYKAGWQENPWLSDELRDEKDYMYKTDPEGADWVWGGNIRKISAAQILRGKWVVEEFKVPYITDAIGQRVPQWDGPYQGQDFGFGVDPAAGVRLWIHERVLYVEHEAWKLHLEIDETAQYFNEQIPDYHLYVARADSSRPDSISFLRRHGLPRIRPAKKHAGSVADGIAHLRSYEKIVIHPRCIHAVQEAKLYSYKVDQRSGDVLPIIVDKHNHIIDSMRYALDPLIKPMRRVGLEFVDDEQIRVCPDCESRVPDDGVCPHCGWSAAPVDAIEEHEPETVVEAIDDLVLEPVGAEDAVFELPHGNGNGNGNGHSNGKNKAFARLRGLNDD